MLNLDSKKWLVGFWLCFFFFRFAEKKKKQKLFIICVRVQTSYM